MNRRTVYAALLVLLVLVLCSLACGSDNTGEKVEKEEEPTAAAKVETYGFGDLIQVKEHTIVLNEASTRNKVLKANFTIENKGDEDLNVSSLVSFSAKDAEGAKLEQEIFDCTSSGLDGKLLPGDKLKGDICWKGLSTESARIYYSASLLGSGAVVWEVAGLETSVSQQPAATTAAATNTPQADEPAKPDATTAPVLELGDTDELEGYSLTAMSVEDPAQPGRLYDAVEGKKLIAVDLIIGNVSGDTVGPNPLSATLVDAEGFVYDTELGGVAGQLAMVDLNPGERVRGWIAFEVPEAATAASIRFEISGYPQILLQTGLGPRSDGETEIAPPAMPARPTFPPLGETVEDQGYSLSAAAVEDPASPGSMYTPQEGTKLLAIEIIAGNVDGAQVTINPLNATLVDTDGFCYRPELGSRAGGQMDMVDLNPGEKARGWITFEVPANATAESIKYEFSGYPSIALQTGTQ